MRNWSWRGVVIAAALATPLALGLRRLAAAAGLEQALFGFSVGINAVDYPVTPTRSAIYPLFVELLRPLGPEGVFAVQAFLYFAAGFALFVRLARLPPPGRPAALLIVLAGAAMVLNPRVLEYPLSISEEALFIPALMALMAALLAGLARPSVASAAMAGVFTGLAIGIRPIGLAFVPMLAAGPIVAVLAAERGRWRAALLGTAAALAAAAAVVGAERWGHAVAVGGAEVRSVLGINLVGKLPFIVERGDVAGRSADAAEEEALRAVEAALLRSGAIAQAGDAAVPSWDGRQFLTNYLEFGYQLNGLNARFGQALADLARLRGQPVDAVALDLSLAVIAKRPMRFAGRALGNFVRFLALVEFPGAAGREQAEAAARRLSAEWPNPDLWDGLRRMAAVAKAYRWQGWILRLANAAAVAGMAMAVALAGGAILRRRRIARDAGFGVLVALGLLAYLLFCAIAINVQVRYVFTVWPLIVSASLLAVLIPARRVGLGSRAAA